MNNGSTSTKRRGGLKRHLAVLASGAMLATVAAVGAAISPASAVATDIFVCAKAGTADIADPGDGGLTNITGVPFLGLVEVASTAACAGATVQLGDPTPIRLTEGQEYNFILVNQSGRTLNLSVAGLTGAPDFAGVLTGADNVANPYNFVAGDPGTYLMESNLDPRHTLLGLHGVVVVDPAIPDGSAHGTAVSAYDNEEILVIHEVDLDFLTSGDPFLYDLDTYNADLHLINGQTHTESTPITPIQADAGDRVLVRYVNASAKNTSMAVQGLRQSQVGLDGEIFDGLGALDEEPADLSNIFLSAGQTADIVLTVDGAAGDQFPIYSRNLRTSAVGNNGAQMVMIQVGVGGVVPGATVYFSLNQGNRNFGGVFVQDEDVARWDGTLLDVYFDGTTHGMAGTDIDAVHVDAATGDVFFSLRQDFLIPLVSSGDWSAVGVPGSDLQEQDVFRFDQAGQAFSVWLDASAIGLDDNRGAHDINGLSVDPLTGVTTFSTNGNIRPAHLVFAGTGSSILWSSTNEDIISWVPDLGAGDPSGAGHFEFLFDGSDFFPLNGTPPRYRANLNGIVLDGSDVLFLEANAVQADLSLAGADNNDLIGCLGHAPAAPASLLDTCASPLSIQFDLNVDLAPTANIAGIGQADAISMG